MFRTDWISVVVGERSTGEGPIKRVEGRGADAREIGRIALGGRRFIVVPAPGSGRSGANEMCRFDLAGHCLAVIETGERRSSNAGDRHTGDKAEDLATRLSGRELEIAALVAQGHANKNIAYRLQISEWTVATYLRRIFLKLDVESRAAMVFRCAPLLKQAVESGPQRPKPDNNQNRPLRD
jgi:DNA-binding CsgD family transcriptional regulator